MCLESFNRSSLQRVFNCSTSVLALYKFTNTKGASSMVNSTFTTFAGFANRKFLCSYEPKHDATRIGCTVRKV